MADFTPGPWQADDTFMEDGHRTRVAMPDVHGIPSETIAECWVTEEADAVHRAIGTVEAEANARVIAAAPELLQVAQMVRDADDDCISDGLPRPLTPAARAAVDRAIAKAEGQAHG